MEILVVVTSSLILIFWYFSRRKFTCPNCGHKQTKSNVINVEDRSYMAHGRITRSGTVDRRYGTSYRHYKITTHNIECQKCKYVYNFIHNPRAEKTDQMINSNPELKKSWNDLEHSIKDGLKKKYVTYKKHGIDTSNLEALAKEMGVKLEDKDSAPYTSQ